MNPADQTDAEETYDFPASFVQHRLWILDQLEPGKGAYNVPMQYSITGPLDTHALSVSLSQLVERHEALRTVFERGDNGDPRQIIMPARPVVLHLTEQFSATSDDTNEWCTCQANAPFDLQHGPLLRAALLRTAPDVHVLSITVHHIAFDGWSVNILQRELHVLYDAAKSGREPVLAELPIQYADFTVWQREQSNTPEFEHRLAYWTSRLMAPLPILEFAAGGTPRVTREHNLGAVALRIDEPTARALRQLALRSGTTPFTVLLAVFQILLHRHSGQDDIIVGTPVSGRASAETESVIGCFVNTLAIRTDLAGSPDFQSMLNRTRSAMLAALANDDVPFEKVVAAVRPDRNTGRNPLFQALFSLYESAPQLSLDGLSVSTRDVSLSSAKVDLQLLLKTTPSCIEGTLEFDCDRFDTPSVERMAQHFVELVTSTLANPEAPIGELAMIGAAEREMVLDEWNQTKRSYRCDATVPQLIAEHVASTPDAIAVRDDAGQLTYRELDARAEAIALQLVLRGVGPDVIVALCVERSLTMLAAALGIMKAGGAYLALDPAYPQARLSHMLSDAMPAVIVAEAGLVDRLPAHHLPIVLLDEIAHGHTGQVRPITSPFQGAPKLESSNLAYVVYTSGSTGMPKGVGVEHRALVNLLQAMEREPGFTSADTLLAVTSLSFDIAALELWLPLVNGARVVIAPRPATVDGDRLAALINESHATVLQATPATWRLLLAAGWTGCKELTMLCGGEALPPTLAAELLPRGRALWNMYGPAETTIWSSVARIAKDSPITLGRPIANTIMRVLDERLMLQPVGVAGELYIGGDGLARGYVNDPDRTASRFIPDPFAAGQRLYRTGDRVRWRPDGTLEFLGRLDDQVKLRGHRIELGEVEHAMATHEDVQACAVILRSIVDVGHDGEMQLIAFYVARPGAAPASEALRAHVRRSLPAAMTPDIYVPIGVLPVGPTGKVDRRALASIDAPAPRVMTVQARSRNTIEHDLVQIWERLLGVHPISIREDFFELGGHSLLAVQMLAEIERVRGRRLPLATLFEDATIESIARKIESAVRAENEPPLVVLQSTGRSRPFAFVHGDAGGGGWYCRRLAPMIGGDVPLIVLGTLDPTSPGNPRSVADVAAIHVRALRDAQPSGPYRIGGFCIGGLIAFEMARQLQAGGHVVDRLILIDASAGKKLIPLLGTLAHFVVRTAFRGDVHLERRSALLQLVHYYSTRIAELREASRAQQLAWSRRMFARVWRKVRTRGVVASLTEIGVMAVPIDATTDASLVEFRMRPGTRAIHAQMQWASVYAPGDFAGRVDIVASDALRQLPDGETVYGWNRVSHAYVHHLSGSHFDMVTKELPALAEVIRFCLGEEEATACTHRPRG
ncbi:MAG: amino acid adenylation domain-containing protein [Gemmatimonadaceae bacterium]